MIIELGIIQQDMVGASGGHHYRGRQILTEMWGHKMSKCKYCKGDEINGRDSIIGAIVGTSILPVIGSVIFGLFGAFGGAVLAEYIQYEKMDDALKTGFWAFVGKLWAYFAKYAIAVAVLVIFIVRSWR